ncbi:unnamed protein product [Periconia digitata]|uniref:Uncharacterized protein n=1 Tax=Periconia digitata TaxID=1303443 RepID=A0A9W4U2M5_9PLEO|nr:unnamed protein product [Periconia digitata]
MSTGNVKGKGKRQEGAPSSSSSRNLMPPPPLPRPRNPSAPQSTNPSVIQHDSPSPELQQELWRITDKIISAEAYIDPFYSSFVNEHLNSLPTNTLSFLLAGPTPEHQAEKQELSTGHSNDRESPISEELVDNILNDPALAREGSQQEPAADRGSELPRVTLIPQAINQQLRLLPLDSYRPHLKEESLRQILPPDGLVRYRSQSPETKTEGIVSGNTAPLPPLPPPPFLSSNDPDVPIPMPGINQFTKPWRISRR